MTHTPTWPPAIRSRPVQWYLLIAELEQYREQTGMGAASIWAAVHRSDYDTARRQLDQLTEETP